MLDSLGTVNKNYLVQVFIGNNTTSADVTAWMPEQLNLQSTSQWNDVNSAFSGITNHVNNSMIGSVLKTLDAGAGALVGQQFNKKFLHFLTWAGNNPLEINLDLQFNAEKDPQAEVINPIMKLLACTMATTTEDTALGSLFVTTPGPKVASMLKDGLSQSNLSSNNWLGGLTNSITSEFNKMSVKDTNMKDDRGVTVIFGNFLRIGNLVVKSVSPRFDTMLTAEGLPISAECNVSFQMIYPPTTDDLVNMLIGGRSNRERVNNG